MLFRTMIVCVAALASFCLAAPVMAQAAGTGLGPTPADPALWVVKDEDTTIYLFGTVHVLRPGLSWFDGRIRQAFDESDELVTEIPEREFEQAMPLLVQRALTDDGKMLSERLTAEQLALYRRAMARMGIPMRVFEPVEPWVPAFILSSGCTCDGYTAAHGVETVLNRAARQRRMATSALESLDMQLGFFDHLSEETQISLLMSLSEAVVHPVPGSGAAARAGMNEMVGRWAAGDVEGLTALLADSFGDTPELHERLIPFRNNNWAQWIQLRLNEPGGKFFVAVGAAHLHGPESVQAQLATMGITVERVEY